MKKLNKLIFIVFVNFSVFSQNTKVEIRNIFEDLNESKQIYYNISLKVSDLKTDEYNRIALLEVRGIDEKGNNLNIDEWYLEDYGLGLEIFTIPMRNEIKKLVSLEGKFKYFSPTNENQSLVVIEDLKEKFNSNLLFEKNKVSQAILLDVEKIKKLSVDSLKYKIEISKIEKKLKTPSNSIFEALNQFYKDYSFEGVNYEKMLVFYCEDNKEEILKINLIDELSNCLHGSYGVNRLKNGKLVVLNLLEVPSEKCKLEFIIENKKSIKNYNFKLTDIDFEKYISSGF